MQGVRAARSTYLATDGRQKFGRPPPPDSRRADALLATKLDPNTHGWYRGPRARKRPKTYGTDGATKTGKARWVDPPRQLCDELAAHLAARDHQPEARVWTGERGGPLAHKWFYTHRFKPVVEELSDSGLLPTIERPAGPDGDAGTFTLRFHDLRHTCVALLIAKGAQQYEVMEHLGHTNIQTTINTCLCLSGARRPEPRKCL